MSRIVAESSNWKLLIKLKEVREIRLVSEHPPHMKMEHVSINSLHNVGSLVMAILQSEA